MSNIQDKNTLTVPAIDTLTVPLLNIDTVKIPKIETVGEGFLRRFEESGYGIIINELTVRE